ncbi:50S ribosomal protein L30 [Candidatus Woesearchaeota archaeon]|nr:MAG: 50S ribosomal protein L30 [Candidatus Woesearchaeota archaeon]
MKTRIAIIRIKGNVNLKQEIKDTFQMLKLYRKNSCVVIPNTPSMMGMLLKVKDFVTWGEINKETFKELLLKRGRLPGKNKLTEDYLKEKLNMSVDDFVDAYFDFKKELRDIPGLKLFFKLSPPVNGFESKGTKKPFSLGGALGYRKDKINDLIKRMV